MMIGTVVFVCLLAFTRAEARGKLYLWFNGNLDGYLCHNYYTVFEEYEPNVQTCALRCGLNTRCKSFFYRESSNTCQGCEVAFSSESTFLPPMMGTKCFYETLGWFPFNGSLYILNGAEATFDVAESICVNLGGHLVNIGSKQENEFLVHLFDINTNSLDVFIGLTDVGNHGNWRWTDDGSTPVFTNFSDIDVLKPNDDYCTVSRHGSWYTVPNDNDAPFICEK